MIIEKERSCIKCMVKKTLRFILKTFWVIIVLFTPTIIALFYYVIRREVSNVGSVAFLYFISIIFIVLIICSILFIWKKSCILFALPIGFLITLKLVPMVLSFSDVYWRAYSSGFGGESLATSLSAILYAIPFAIITLIIATVIKWANDKEKAKMKF